MRPVKAPVLITISLFTAIPVLAQIKVPFHSFRNDIASIVKDYPNHFQNIIAEELAQNPQSTDYRSAVSVNGAEDCIVTRHSSKTKEIYSLKATMLTTDDFEKAKKTFKTLYNQLNNMTVNFNTGQTCLFKGSFEMPVEEKKFTSTVFSPSPGNETIKNLKIELTMEYELLEWKIRILVYGKEREDDERGATKE